MKALHLSFLMLIICSTSFAQNTMDQSGGWGRGSILLTNGTMLNGHVKYDHHRSYITYRDGDNNNKVFTSRNFVQVNLYDEDRVLVALPYMTLASEQEQFVVFEVLKEFASFTVLSRREPAHTLLSSTAHALMSTPITRYAYQPDEINQETIFILNDAGDIKPYMKTVYKDGPSAQVEDSRYSKGKILDENLLVHNVGVSDYRKLQAFALDNQLKFSRKPDLMKVLAYYETINR